MAHEYTHCFTTTTMTTNLYLNDYGAINEGMSDILGNLAAMMTDETDEPFVIGEKCADIVKRTMGDPNIDSQPEYVWDRYYLPEAPFSTEFNDNGGVHTNSSLLNILSYKLDKAGMDPVDQFYYWMNVSFAMTPKSDYDQMLDILPWVMERIGQNEYVPVMKKALEETGLYDRDLPKAPKGNYGIVTVTIPSDDVIDNNYINVIFFDMNDENDFTTYPEVGTDRIAATLPAGKYWMQMQFIDPETYDQVYVLPHEGGWEMMAPDDVQKIMNKQDRSYTIDVKAGEVLELDGDALGELLLS